LNAIFFIEKNFQKNAVELSQATPALQNFTTSKPPPNLKIIATKNAKKHEDFCHRDSETTEFKLVAKLLLSNVLIREALLLTQAELVE